MQWTDRRYKTVHIASWTEAVRVLKLGGTFVLNISDHYRTLRKKEPPILQRVTDWHIGILCGLGLVVVEHHKVATPRHRHGENHALRPEYESVIVFRKPE
jgi:hypothetical protein